MFDLEKSITNWRKQMQAAGIKTPVPLEELETHLREDIARQMKSGLDARQAFVAAVKSIGQAPELKREFKKVNAPMDMQKIIKLAGIICITVALFCSLMALLPVFFNQGLSWLTRVFVLAVLAITVATIVFSWRFNHKLLPVIHNQLLRKAVGIGCYVGCLLWIRLVLFHFPEHLPRSILLPVLIFGSKCTVLAILGGVGHGLEKAASKKSAAIDLLASQS